MYADTWNMSKYKIYVSHAPIKREIAKYGEGLIF